MLEKSPDAFKTISEAAEELGVEQHVLRFWETKFTQIKPMKRRGGRRFYRPDDMEILHRIQSLLYQQGFTIKGAKKALSAKAEPAVAEAATGKPAKGKKAATAAVDQLELLGAAPAISLSKSQKDALKGILKNLQSMRKDLQSAV